MKQNIIRPLRLAVLTLSAVLAAGSAFADKPSWAGNGKGKKQDDRVEQRGGQSSTRFGDQHRRIIAEYYGGQMQPGRKCPPGLAKKNNGCMPPGQAKKWGMGRPLPGVLGGAVLALARGLGEFGAFELDQFLSVFKQLEPFRAVLRRTAVPPRPR